jgi:hypothetical protein
MTGIGKLLLPAALIAVLGPIAGAQTINAASCNKSDVQAAFSAATASTTTINIPAGTCHWTASATLTVPSGSTTLSVLGAGSLTTQGGGDVTVIVDDDATDSTLINLATNSSASSFLRFAGITIQGGANNGKYNGIIALTGYSQNVRIDHNHINTQTYAAGSAGGDIRFNNWIYGVVDHNIFDNNDGAVQNDVQVDMGSYAGDSWGDGSWADQTSFGSGKFVFVEDNTFNYGFVNDCSAGGRIVVRYNTMKRAPVQTHPTGGGGRVRGCRAEEVYQNTMNGTAADYYGMAIWNSSGTALIWGNQAPTGWQNFIQLHSMRRNNSTYPQSPVPNGWGYCGTSFNGIGSPWDGNLNPTNGYPCLDQPGRGKTDLLGGGDFPSALNMLTSTIVWPHQALEPIYEWLDTWSPVPDNPGSLFSITDSTSFVANRDYYQYTSSFNGTSGVGSGPLSARPSTCTPMVAYWETDHSQLDYCYAANTWSTPTSTPASYTPYTYPHPLTQGSTTSSSGTAPSAPTNLTASVE